MAKRWIVGSFVVIIFATLAGCTGRGGVSISVSPPEVTLAPGETQVFTAAVLGARDASVTWTASGGDLVPSGSTATFTAPAETGEVLVTATSTQDRGRQATAVVTVAEADGTVVLVAPVDPLPGAAADDLMVVTPFREYAVGPDVTEAEFSVMENVTSLVALMDVGRDFGWVAVWPAWFAEDAVAAAGAGGARRMAVHEVVGAASTAVASVFVHPGIYHTDVAAARAIVDGLRAVPEIAALASLLEDHADVEDPFSVPAVQVAYEDALAAAFVVLGVVDDTAPTASAEVGDDLAPSTARLEYLLDVGVTSLSVDGRSLLPSWRSTYASGGRGLSWAGRVYEVDVTQYDSFTELRDQWTEDRWRGDIALRPDPGMGGMYLAADTFWAQLDFVTYAIDVAIDWLVSGATGEDGLDGALGVTFPERDALYVAHMYSCGIGLGAVENALDDWRLLRAWPGALNAHVAACRVNVFEMALDLVSLVLAADALLSEEAASLLEQASESLFTTVPGAFRSAVALDDYIYAIGFIATDLARGMATDMVKVGLASLLKFKAQQFAKAVNLPSLASRSGKVGARLGALIGITPVEFVAVQVGDPWRSRPAIASFVATPNPVAAGSPTAFSWSVAAADGGVSCVLTVAGEGGGTTYEIPDCAGTTSQDHTYTTPGTYAATLTASAHGFDVRAEATVTVQGSSTLIPGTVAHYAFEDAGNVGADTLGGHDATAFGAPTLVDGVVGRALWLDGSDDYLRRGSLLGGPTFEAYTHMGWLRMASLTSLPAPAASMVFSDETTDGQFGLRITADGGFMPFHHDGSGWLTLTGPTLQTDQWYHYAVTWDGERVHAYLDGTEVGSFAATRMQSVGQSSGLGIGTLTYWLDTNLHGGGLFHGALDELRVVDRALDAAEVRSVFEAESTGSPHDAGVGLLAHYAFDACDGTDSAGGGFHALLPTTVTCIDGPMGGAVAFDGRTGAVVEIPVLPTGAASRSIAAWVRLDGGGGSMADQGIAGWGGISNRRAFSLRYGIGSSYTYGLWLHGCTYDLIVGGGDCVGGSPHEVTGTWHHLAGVYDASEELAILYLDGQETARRVVALDTATTSLGIGMDAEHGVPFHGAIDDLRVYGRALAPDEVRGLHALGTP